MIRCKNMGRYTRHTIAILIVAFLWINAPGVLDTVYTWQKLPPLHEFAFSKDDRVLILSPHPDDETLCCGGLLQQAEAAGAQVYIAWMTNGDGFEWDARILDKRIRPNAQNMIQLGNERMEEARMAATHLGVPQDRMFFLGYPDGGLLTLLTHASIRPFTSKNTHVFTNPYTSTVSLGQQYTGLNWRNDVMSLFATVRPTVVLAPDTRDMHSDHSATGMMGAYATDHTYPRPMLYTWIIHGGVEWPLPKGLHTHIALLPPPVGKGLDWVRLPLSSSEVDIKKKALKEYKTQLLVMNNFLMSFIRSSELFVPLQ